MAQNTAEVLEQAMALEKTMDSLMKNFNGLASDQRKLCTLEETRLEEIALEMEKRRRRWHKREKEGGGETPIPRRIQEKRRERESIQSMMKASDASLLSPVSKGHKSNSGAFCSETAVEPLSSLLPDFTEQQLTSVDGVSKCVEEINSAVEKVMTHISTSLAVERQNKVSQTLAMQQEMTELRQTYIDELHKLQKIYLQQSRTCRESAEFPELLKKSYGTAIQSNITRWQASDNNKNNNAKDSNSTTADYNSIDGHSTPGASPAAGVSEDGLQLTIDMTEDEEEDETTTGTTTPCSAFQNTATGSKSEGSTTPNSCVGGGGGTKSNSGEAATGDTNSTPTTQENKEKKSRVVIPEGSKPVPTPRSKGGNSSKGNTRATPRATPTPRTKVLVSGTAPTPRKKT